MRVLHTSDWHLGKHLMNKSRLLEQQAALDELFLVAKEQKIDVILVCGDIFDTFVPKAEAEELFYDSLYRLSQICKIVCIAGNHDDGSRLKAPSQLAKNAGIYLIGDMDNNRYSSSDAEGGDGWLRLIIGGEILNLALLPYPFFSGMISQTSEGNNEERIKQLIDRCCQCFGKGVNIFASHLFISGSELAEDRELGTAPVLSKSVLPNCDYVALGHIHRPQTVSRRQNIYYSGSLLKYSFDDAYDKVFYIYDSADKSVKTISIKAGKPLITAKATSFLEAEELLKNNLDAYVKLIYSGPPLMMSEIKTLKSYYCFTDIKIESLAPTVKIQRIRADASPKELFELFYKARENLSPKDDLTQLFLSILGEDNATN